MARAVWKGPYVHPSLIKKAEKVRASKKNEVIRTWARSSVILPLFVGMTVAVYNGKQHIPVLVNEQMVGHKFGEFAPTRTFKGHTPADKKAEK